MEQGKNNRTRCLFASSLYLEVFMDPIRFIEPAEIWAGPLKQSCSYLLPAKLLLNLLQSYWDCLVIGNTQAHQRCQKGIKHQKKLGKIRFILFYFLMRMFSFMMTDIPSAGAVSPHVTNEDVMQRANHRTLVSWR